MSNGTIIIPAHNEENVIHKTLTALSPKENADYYEVIVVCNGCSDNTFNLVKEKFPSVVCLAIPEASKALAIRHAEAHTNCFPRIYLDADIKLSASDAREMIKASQKFPQKLILPKSKTDHSNSSLFVRLYYKYWYKTPFVTWLGYGCGTYALSEEARNSFGEWPNLISDDGYIRQLFKPEKIQIIDDACVVVSPPKTLSGLIKIKTRSKYGTLELKDFLSPNEIHKKKIKLSFKPILTSPLAFINYLFINIIARLKAQQMYKKKNFSWIKDNSSRNI